jgi:Family of unknown function (DUF6879)
MVRCGSRSGGLTLWGRLHDAWFNPWIRFDRRDRTMHPRMLARDDGCSGGTCPAVYDDDPDLQPDELAIVGTQAAGPLYAKLSGRIAPHEELIVIKREIVAEALRPADEPVDLDGLMAELTSFSYSAFRPEGEQVYTDTGRDEEWVSLVKAGRRWGKTYQRVHIVIEPLTGSMEQELTEGYGPNYVAGEDIGIIPVAAGGHWPQDIPHSTDFWLFDSTRLYVMHYEPDGAWRGASRVRDPWKILQLCKARDAALHHAIPWRRYIASRPDLKRRLAQ